MKHKSLILITLLFTFGCKSDTVPEQSAVQSAEQTPVQSAIPEAEPVAWDKTVWGMSSDELKGIYGAKIIEIERTENEPDNTYSNLEINGIVVNDTEFKAVPWMDSDSGGLTSITVSPAVRGKNFEHRALYAKMLTGLIEEHGEPDISYEREKTAKADWLLPGTHIELIYRGFDEYNEFLFLVYKSK